MSKKKVIAERLREARERAGKKQGEAADLLGLHRPAMCEIEAGRRHVRAEELGQLARFYGVSIEWLLGLE